MGQNGAQPPGTSHHLLCATERGGDGEEKSLWDHSPDRKASVSSVTELPLTLTMECLEVKQQIQCIRKNNQEITEVARSPHLLEIVKKALSVLMNT